MVAWVETVIICQVAFWSHQFLYEFLTHFNCRMHPQMAFQGVQRFQDQMLILY